MAAPIRAHLEGASSTEEEPATLHTLLPVVLVLAPARGHGLRREVAVHLAAALLPLARALQLLLLAQLERLAELGRVRGLAVAGRDGERVGPEAVARAAPVAPPRPRSGLPTPIGRRATGDLPWCSTAPPPV